jgi:hypothetical protein
MDRPSIQEQLDACRDTAQAANDPMLRGLAAAMQSDPLFTSRLEEQFAADAELKSQLEKVSVPSGLRDQLAASFRQAVALQQQDRSRLRGVIERSMEAAVESNAAPEECEAKKPSLSSRRRWPMKVIGALAFSSFTLVLLLWMFVGSTRQVDLNSRDFAKQALLHLDDPGEWNSTDSTPAPPLNYDPSALPISKDLAPRRWRRIDSQHPGIWIVWELESNASEHVYVLTVSADWKPGLLPNVLSQRPTLDNTANWSVGVFRSQGISYAVIVEGDEGRFRGVVNFSNSVWHWNLTMLRFWAA